MQLRRRLVVTIQSASKGTEAIKGQGSLSNGSNADNRQSWMRIRRSFKKCVGGSIEYNGMASMTLCVSYKIKPWTLNKLKTSMIIPHKNEGPIMELHKPPVNVLTYKYLWKYSIWREAMGFTAAQAFPSLIFDYLHTTDTRFEGCKHEYLGYRTSFTSLKMNPWLVYKEIILCTASGPNLNHSLADSFDALVRKFWRIH